MFESLKKFINEFEKTINDSGTIEMTEENKSILYYSDLHLAESLITDWGDSAKTVAKIILAATEK